MDEGTVVGCECDRGDLAGKGLAACSRRSRFAYADARSYEKFENGVLSALSGFAVGSGIAALGKARLEMG